MSHLSHLPVSNGRVHSRARIVRRNRSHFGAVGSGATSSGGSHDCGGGSAQFPSGGEVGADVGLSCLSGRALLGDSLMYGVGRYLGKAYLRKHRWFSKLLHAERERQMETLLQRNGLKVFLLARFLVGVRSPIYLAAGIVRIPYRRFLLVDATCATLVVGTFFWLSHFCGEWIGPLFHESQIVVTLVILAGVVGMMVNAGWRTYRQSFVDQPDLDDDNVEVAPDGCPLPKTEAGDES